MNAEHYAQYGRLAYGNKIAVFNLCKMSYDRIDGKCFSDLFTEERTCDIYADDGDTVIEEDCYGDSIKKPKDNSLVLKWLEKHRKMSKDDLWYREIVFRDFLKSLEKNNVEYSLYHYGY
jgi:hypothetical protein